MFDLNVGGKERDRVVAIARQQREVREREKKWIHVALVSWEQMKIGSIFIELCH